MVFALEAIMLGVPVLVLANDQSVAGFVIKAFLCVCIPFVTVACIFSPKVAMAYGIGLIDGESNPWRFVKGDSSGSNRHSASKAASPEHAQSSKGFDSKKQAMITPSLNSLVSGRVVVTTNHDTLPRVSSKVNMNGAVLARESSSGGGKPACADVPPTPANQLKAILESNPERRKFRKYLQTLKMDETVKFWDCVTVFKNDSVDKRPSSARAIVQTFVSDSAPFQVNLSSDAKNDLMKAVTRNDIVRLSDESLFNRAIDELFRDLKQSDAFRKFIDTDVTSMINLDNNSYSGPEIL